MSWLFRTSVNAEGDALVDPEVGDAEGTADSSRGWFHSLPSFRREPELEEEEQGPNLFSDENLSVCGEMSYQTRLYGFLACFAMGTILSISSSFMVPALVFNPAKFALPYTLGNILSVASSLFFVGPNRFCATMFNESRRLASILYFTTMLGTLFAALILHSGFLAFILIVVQFASYLWLMASYIPFGRRMLSSAASRASAVVLS
mmetsp:Transcript_6004/g.11203  ORF Transcript_6004/g.11203 Transcript_6004/m.11203 type:complete len:205 (+) Transcript_6004:260-874(+)